MKLLFTLVLSILYFTGFAGDLTIYVSSNGSGKGSVQSPTSLQKAIAMLPGLKKNNPKGSITIVLLDGQYELDQPILITNENGGTKDLKIIFKAAANAHVVISGGKEIVMKGNTILSALVPNLVKSMPYDLYINEKRATRARTPNVDFLTTVKVEKVSDASQKVNNEGRAVFTQQYIIPSSMFDVLASLPKNELQKVRFNLYYKWDNIMRNIDSLNPAKKSFYSTGTGTNTGTPSMFYVENYPAALDTGNEWELENETIRYIPVHPKHQQDAIVPVLEKLLTIRGDSTSPVQNIVFDQIEFKYCNHVYDGYEHAQAAQKIDAAIMIDNAEGIVFSHCEVAHTGQYAIWLRKGVRNCEITNCYLHDLGAGGVRIGETVIRGNKAQWTASNKVDNCIIHTGGLDFPSAVGVFIAHSADNVISHNDIGDFRYSGISVGWIWGYAFSPSNHNKIIYNNIHHLGWGVLSDMAAVYTLGISDGTEVSHNVIHDVYTYDYGGWGLYTDEGSSNIRMENNLVYRTKTGGFHQHYGKDNMIRNNIIAFNDKYQAQDSRIEEHKSFDFIHNIIITDKGTLMQGAWKNGKVNIDSNCYWNMNNEKCLFMLSTMAYGGKPIDSLSFAQWQKNSGRDVHSVFEDPGFVDAKHDNFKFKSNSVVGKIGFVPFDYSEAGVTGDKQWMKLALLPKEITDAYDASVKKNMLP
jgi:parallel beta-helix repeat protein